MRATYLILRHDGYRWQALARAPRGLTVGAVCRAARELNLSRTYIFPLTEARKLADDIPEAPSAPLPLYNDNYVGWKAAQEAARRRLESELVRAVVAGAREADHTGT